MNDGGTIPSLGTDEVQLWRIGLGETAALLDSAYAVLTDAEREQAARKRAGAPRDEFVAGRGCLRRLLGAALGVDPRALALETGAHGKPRLRTSGLWFNVAHSRGVILIGLSRAGEIGVDVEFVNPEIEVMDVARTAFHVDDVARVERAESPVAEFYRCWARKEAVAKADGRGLLIEITSFAAGSDSDDEFEVRLPEALGGRRFFVSGVDAGPSHAAAVATTVSGLAVRIWEISPRSGPSW